ncbi:hypothetical protein ACSDR0_47845 [Streptosporangium sp. G11]|uniref:hypothetical protein n=1 Tax=Streptosporangium sp. G11 TaxID=3436926 RepID=UPI003EBE3C1C
MANSYASLAARGRFCEPIVITEIRDGSGAPRLFPPRCRQVTDPAVADAVTGVLSDVLTRSTLTGLGREAAGMPGAVDSFAARVLPGRSPAYCFLSRGGVGAAGGLLQPAGVDRGYPRG